jgi:outer membrane lipoprotein-sorting protein
MMRRGLLTLARTATAFAGACLACATLAQAQPLQLPSAGLPGPSGSSSAPRPPAPLAPRAPAAAPPQARPVQAAPESSTPRPVQQAAPAAPSPPRVPLPIPRPAGLEEVARAEPPARAPAEARSAPAETPAPQAERAAPPPPAVEKPAPVQVAAVDNSPRAVLDRVNASLNAMSSMSANFVQTGGNGRRTEGRLYVQKPGKLRFEYQPPTPLEIIADGSSVVIRDRKLGTQDLYGIGQTPLKFLLRDKVDLARDTKLVDVQPGPDLVSVTIEDRATFGGTSRIELFFDAKTYGLRQWIVTDPQGYQTAVNLRNIDTAHRPDPSLFLIDYSRNYPNVSNR